MPKTTLEKNLEFLKSKNVNTIVNEEGTIVMPCYSTFTTRNLILDKDEGIFEISFHKNNISNEDLFIPIDKIRSLVENDDKLILDMKLSKEEIKCKKQNQQEIKNNIKKAKEQKIKHDKNRKELLKSIKPEKNKNKYKNPFDDLLKK